MKRFAGIKPAVRILYDKYAVFFLCAAIIFFRLPPLQPVPGAFPLLQTHNLVRVIILALAAASLLVDRRDKPVGKELLLSGLVLLYFLSQSLSVISVSNLQAFLSVYKDIFISVLIFFVTARTVSRQEHLRLVALALVAAAAVNLAFQLLTYFFPSFVTAVLSPFFYDKYWQYFSFQTDRNRFFGDSFDETLIPLLFSYLAVSKKMPGRITAILLIAAIVFITYISSWRTKAIILVVMMVWAYFTLNKIRYKPVLIVAIFASALLANAISLSTTGFNVYDRFLFDDTVQTQTIAGRFDYWKEATEVGMENPLLGVGLGNYFDHLPQQSKNQKMRSILDRTIVIDDPHDIFFSTFAASGLFGLLSLMAMLAYFVYYDAKHFHTPRKNFIIMSWGLFIFALLNPFQYAGFLYYFWFLRGVIASPVEK